jgi:hypothetical protein
MQTRAQRHAGIAIDRLLSEPRPESSGGISREQLASVVRLDDCEDSVRRQAPPLFAKLNTEDNMFFTATAGEKR